MALWKIEPVANPDDPWWQDHKRWQRVIVRADSPAVARLIAAELERGPDQSTDGNASDSFRSAFEDEKLYWVKPLPAEEAKAYDATGAPAVLEAGQTE